MRSRGSPPAQAVEDRVEPVGLPRRRAVGEAFRDHVDDEGALLRRETAAVEIANGAREVSEGCRPLPKRGSRSRIWTASNRTGEVVQIASARGKLTNDGVPGRDDLTVVRRSQQRHEAFDLGFDERWEHHVAPPPKTRLATSRALAALMPKRRAMKVACRKLRVLSKEWSDRPKHSELLRGSSIANAIASPSARGGLRIAQAASFALPMTARGRPAVRPTIEWP